MANKFIKLKDAEGNYLYPATALPTASTDTLGGVKVDGETITISDGVITAEGGGTVDFDEIEELTGAPALGIAYGGTGASTVAGARANLGIDINIKINRNVSVLASSWVSDNTYTDYPYKSEVSISGVDATWFPEVFVGANQQNLGLATFAESYSGGVRLFAEQALTNDIIIPMIRCNQ